jgi:hypothetical protein
MFSTIDSVRERTVVARVRAGGQEFPVPLTGRLAASRDRVQAQPTRANGQRLAREVLRMRWQTPGQGGAAAHFPESVRIEVRRIQFTGASNLLSAERMLAVDVAR